MTSAPRKKPKVVPFGYERVACAMPIAGRVILDVVSRRQLQRLAEITDRWWKRVDDSVVAVPAGDPTIAEGDDDIEVPVVIGMRAHWHRAAREPSGPLALKTLRARVAAAAKALPEDSFWREVTDAVPHAAAALAAQPIALHFLLTGTASGAELIYGARVEATERGDLHGIAVGRDGVMRWGVAGRLEAQVRDGEVATIDLGPEAQAARDEATKHAPGERGFWIDVHTE